jgi:capsular polysaccharide transport system permease protein
MSSDATPPPALVRAPRPLGQAWAVMRAVVFALFLRELKTRMGGRWWGIVWIIGEPVASAAVLLAMYSLAHARVIGGVDTLLFLVSGLLPFQLFKQLVLRSMESIDANQGLFAYRQVRPIDAVVARALVELVLAVAVATVAVSLLAWLGHDVSPRLPLELIGTSLLLVALGTTLGLLAAVATGGALARARAAIRVASMPLMLVSGVAFPVAVLPPAAREALALNPLLHLLEGVRGAVFGSTYHAMPETTMAWPAAAWLVGATLALALYVQRRERLRTS